MVFFNLPGRGLWLSQPPPEGTACSSERPDSPQAPTHVPQLSGEQREQYKVDLVYLLGDRTQALIAEGEAHRQRHINLTKLCSPGKATSSDKILSQLGNAVLGLVPAPGNAGSLEPAQGQPELLLSVYCTLCRQIQICGARWVKEAQ